MAECEIVPLLDTEGSFATYAEAFPELSAEEIEAERDRWPQCFRGEALWLPFRVFLLRGAVTAVVDAGLGPPPNGLLPDAPTRLPHELERVGVAPEDVELAVFTHLHVDHVGWAPLFTSARAVVPAADWTYFDRVETHEKFASFEERGALELVEGAQTPAPGIELVPTPGHTPGHTSVRAGDTLIVGDVVVTPTQFTNPDLVFAPGDHDGALAARTRRATLTQLAAAGTRIASPHLPSPFGRADRAGEGFAWRPSN
jgi:glyoxylase-like metal-dependent hydrolase (beta-lactamase superfamily II)